jgi:hypothetical protein
MKLHEIAEEDLPIIYDLVKRHLEAHTPITVVGKFYGRLEKIMVSSSSMTPMIGIKYIMRLGSGQDSPEVQFFTIQAVEQWKLKKLERGGLALWV